MTNILLSSYIKSFTVLELSEFGSDFIFFAMFFILKHFLFSYFNRLFGHHSWSADTSSFTGEDIKKFYIRIILECLKSRIEVFWSVNDKYLLFSQKSLEM